MFTFEMLESFLFIGVITAVIAGYAIALGRRNDRDAVSSADVLKHSASISGIDSGHHKKIA